MVEIEGGWNKGWWKVVEMKGGWDGGWLWLRAVEIEGWNKGLLR